MSRRAANRFMPALEFSAVFVLVIFLVEGVDSWLRVRTDGEATLDVFGIIPRTPVGLVGILTAPLLHAGMAHLLANAAPLFVLLTLLFWDRHYRPGVTLSAIWLASGLGTWLIGRPGSIHIGASSVIYGLVSYLVVSGFLMKSWRSAIVAIVVLLAYGGIFYGVLPQAGPISWEGHLSGAIAGVWVARENHD